MVYAALRNAFTFSGSDDSANEIEGLRHGGVAEQNRKLHTDFGSGYRTGKYHTAETQDPSETNFIGLGAIGATAGVTARYWNKPFGNVNVDDLGYLGRLHPDLKNSQVMNRTKATLGDIITGGVKRAESIMGGFPRSFGVGDVLSSSLLDDAVQTIDITNSSSSSFAKYIDKLTNRKLLEEGVESVTFSKGKLYLTKKGFSEKVAGNFSLRRINTDLNQVESMTQLSKSMTRMQGVNYIDPTKIPFIPVGGKGFLNSPGMQTGKAYVHETFSKYLRLMDDPLEAVREMFPDVDMPAQKKLKKFMKKFPKLGVGGELGLNASTTKMMSNHAMRLGAAGALLYFGFGTADWATRQLAPEGSVLGDAGIVGAGAEAVRFAHQSYSRFSDATGMTGFRDYVGDLAPGMDGWQATMGLTLSGGVAGLVYGAAENVAEEVFASGKRYEKFIENKKAVEKLPEFVRSIPGMKGEYTKVSRFGRMGALAGFVAAIPWTIAGIGADQSYNELEEIYEGRQEVAVKKGRFWEAGMTPWGGSKTDYYRPGWYSRLRDDAKTAEVYGGEDISPVGKAVRSLLDPYWLEKKRWDDQPYPYAGPDGSPFGIFGPLYEATLGRALKAPVLMHQDEFRKGLEEREKRAKISAELGGVAPDIVTPDDWSSILRKQWSSTLEAVGLRGFVAGSLKEAVTGEKELNSYTEELANASAIDSPVKAFHDMQLGGGALTTEAARRVFAREEVGSVSRVNLIKNNMPYWMPGSGFYINFKQGDPFSKVKEGYYRLPGEGYATRYEELKGISPEDYPDIFKYRILADVASGSKEFANIKQKLKDRVLTPKEMTMFNQTEAQLEEKKNSKENFRDPEQYETMLGKYSAFLTDLTRSSPAEQLLPFSPAAKFLGNQSPIEAYEETIYGKTFKQWSRPFDDFVMPAVYSALNSMGMGTIPEDVQYARDLEDHFDKIKFVKNMRLAEQAEHRGEGRAAAGFRKKASGTLSGVDPYADAEEIKKIIPVRERRFFDRFLNAGQQEKRKILDLSSDSMRDIYLAQWDKQDIELIERGALETDRDSKMEHLAELKNRAEQLRATRRAEVREFSRSEAIPEDDWSGWDKRVDLQDVKMQYLVNEGHDYHYYGLWKDRLRMLARKPYVQAAAEDLAFEPQDRDNAYSSALEKAREMGIVNPEISIMPGLKEGIHLEVQMEREEERRIALKDLGYVI
jgi:hypothetical protein